MVCGASLSAKLLGVVAFPSTEMGEGLCVVIEFKTGANWFLTPLENNALANEVKQCIRKVHNPQVALFVSSFL